ncbi:alpha/beta-hydrolase [Gymnopus androsaceus JB14]|uniref:Carboxylic ester hydrolase n=1 Tax=Gymnopus androsaceus JB14 TaxID=1447944 RepID=A0A6A4I1T0_9AGAR|nr:alpha/beta-hydrolase [Gymnopus androsaceus JB14]
MKILHILLQLSNVLLALSLQSVSENSRSVALLFENDGNWENLGDRTSALLFYDPETLSDASQVCQEFNETLFSSENLPDIFNKLSYLEHLGEFDETTEFWVSSTGSGSAISPFSTSAPNSDVSTKLPFLCSNSAPLTAQVDTDFPSLPRMNVTSNGVAFTGVRDHLTFRFMGIPYAAPPTGPLRFQYPEKWNGSQVDATVFKTACLQFGAFADNSSDCLYLNVYSSYIPSSSPPAALRPVFVWIHGGGNVNGMGSDETFDGVMLSSFSINYRLNIFGFLGLDSAIPGNYAMADKIAALQWVQDHIKDFGGDSSRVTIFGQSAGGWSIVDLLKSPKATGLFHAAISQSGGSGTFTTYEALNEMVEPFISPLCNGTGTELLQCLQALPADVVLNITNFAGSWSTVIDGVYALDSAVNQMALGPSAVNSVPFMLGFMPEEGQSLLGTTISPNATDFNESLVVAVGSSLAEDVLKSGLWIIDNALNFTVYNATIDVYTDWFLTCPAETMIGVASKSKAFSAMYVYSMQRAYGLTFFDPFDLCTFPVGMPQPYYRCHSGDLYEVFGTYHIFAQPVRVPPDIAYTNLVQDLWSAFARTGDPNPNQEDLAAQTDWIWPKYDDVSMQRAALDYPELTTVIGLPDDSNGRCAVITAGSGT